MKEPNHLIAEVRKTLRFLRVDDCDIGTVGELQVLSGILYSY